MTTMIDFSSRILTELARFLGSEPIIYLFGLVCLCFVAKTVKIIFSM